MRKKIIRSRKSNKTITTGKQGTGISSNLSLWRHFVETKTLPNKFAKTVNRLERTIEKP